MSTLLRSTALDRFLQVYDAHGTQPAAVWAGVGIHAARYRVVTSGRPLPSRGRPNLAELARRAPRHDCLCPMCDDVRAKASAQRRRESAHTIRLIDRQAETPDTDWRLFAACADPDVDPAWFYPTDTETDKARQAKAICAGCSVRDRCLDYAVAAEYFGIWGGLGQRERARERARRKRSAA